MFSSIPNRYSDEKTGAAVTNINQYMYFLVRLQWELSNDIVIAHMREVGQNFTAE